MIWFIISMILLLLSAKYLGPGLFWVGFILTSIIVSIIKFNPGIFENCYIINNILSMEWYWLLSLPIIGGVSLAFIFGFMIGWASIK